VFPKLNGCVATVTAGSCPTPARLSGASTARRDCCCGHRAPWSHQGGTWGLPGGARDSHETPEQAAVREAHEEAGLPAHQLTVRTTVVTAEISGTTGAYWTYTTVIADAAELLETVPNRESSELRWVAVDEVAELPLHPGFAASWERLREVAATIPLQAEL